MRAIPALATARRLQVASAPSRTAFNGKWKVFELRTYDIRPDRYGAFLALTKEKIGMRFAASPALGYWTTEIGGLNQVVHVWPYESLSHRAKVRAELGKNPTWKAEYMDLMLPMLRKQMNLLLDGQIVAEPPQGSASPGAYELRVITPKGGTEVPLAASGTATLLGNWRSVLGETGLIVQLWRYPGVDEAASNKPAALGVTRKLLIPTAWSEWK